MSILTENYIVKNVRAYPVLREKFMAYMKGVKNLPEGFRENKLFHDYLKVRRNNPEKRVSQSEYMIFGFYNLSTGEQKKYLTDVEATRLMRPYNNDSEPYLKSKATFLKNFTRFIHRGWLYVPKASYEEFCDFLHKYRTIALKPQYSSWGIGFFQTDGGRVRFKKRIRKNFIRNYAREDILRKNLYNPARSWRHFIRRL